MAGRTGRGTVKKSEVTEISQALPIQHPMYLGIEPLVTALILEGVGAALNHIWHWPFWIGAQLPVSYLLWKWSDERRFAHHLSRAWNKKRDTEVELSRQLREALQANEAEVSLHGVKNVPVIDHDDPPRPGYPARLRPRPAPPSPRTLAARKPRQQRFAQSP